MHDDSNQITTSTIKKNNKAFIIQNRPKIMEFLKSCYKRRTGCTKLRQVSIDNYEPATGKVYSQIPDSDS